MRAIASASNVARVTKLGKDRSLLRSRRAVCQSDWESCHFAREERTEEGGGSLGTIHKGRPQNFRGFGPLPPCPNFGLIYSSKSKQPPLLPGFRVK